MGLDRDLHNLRPSRSHRSRTLAQICRGGSERMKGKHDAATTATPCNRRDEFGACFNIDKLGTRVLRVRQDALAFLFGSAEAAAFPRRSTRHQHGPSPSLNRTDWIRAIDEVEAHFYQIGKGRCIALAPQLLHRPSGDRGAQLWATHGS